MQAIQQYQHLKALLVAWHDLGLEDWISASGLIHYAISDPLTFFEVELILSSICVKDGRLDAQVLYEFLCATEGFLVDGYVLESLFNKKKIFWRVLHFRNEVGTISKSLTAGLNEQNKRS